MRTIDEVRSDIDENAVKLLRLIKDRNDLVAEIGAIKNAQGVQPLDESRWGDVVNKVRGEGEKQGLDPDFIEGVWDLFHKEALRIESRE